MDLNKLKISDLVAEQLPDFVVNEFPTFVKFFEEYYRSLEISGGIGDITENFLDYTNLENLRKFDLVQTYELQQDISSTATSIVLDKLDGLPSENGVIKIDDEIIFYRSINLTARTLLECERGFSGITEYSDNNTTSTSTVAATHLADAKVTNLSNLIKFLIVRNYEIEYLDGFPFENISDEISRDTLVRNIKDFYSYKGTDLSIEFLFRALFAEEVTVRYPKDYVIKSSFSDWTVDDVIKVEEIDGNPYNLIGNELNQTDAGGKDVKVAVIDQILVNNIQNYPSGSKNVYEIRLNVTNNQYFTIPSNTIVRGTLSATSSVVTVDSTIGFPELNGIIEIDDEIITYRYKTFNQFIDCGRGSYNTVAVSHANLQPVITTEILFGYNQGDRIESNKIKLRLLGSLSTTSIVDGSNYYNENEPITLSLDGTVDDREQFNSWRKNEIGSFGSSSDVQINNAVKTITSGVTSVYKDKNFAYIASTGLPTHPIGSFRGAGFDIKNQNLLKSIPLVTEKNTQEQFTKNTPVGLFVNGVEAFSAQDYEDVPFGDITDVIVTSTGFGFESDVQPVFRVVDGVGSNATFHANITDGKVISVDVVDGGSGYTSDRVFEVTYGFDATASVLNDGDLVFGQIKNISVTNPGVNYVIAPRVEIIDISGKGNGAFATAQINNNEVVGITVLNGGVDYTDKGNIRINIISKASGVQARSIVRKWSFDRVFKTTHDKDNSGNWAVAQTIKSDNGNGYLYASRNIVYNLQYGYPSNPKILRHLLSDNVQGVNANYNEKTSGFVHSPILGWAYDGNPIYGPYSYSQPLNENSGISRQTSSYRLKTTSLATRPSTSVYPLGAFIQDYEYVQGNGSLDKNNGRFCKTPEYPNGRYCYFISVDNLGAGVYPYILGTTYQSVPAQYNFNIDFNQSNQNNLPSDVRRIRSANTPSQGFDASLLVGEVQRGEISSFTVNSSGDSFKNLDFIYIDNTDTEGSRSFGRVGKIEGRSVSTLSYGVSPGFSASGFTTTNNIPDLPWPIDISGPEYVEQGLTFDISVETTEPHLLSNNDQVTLSLDKQSLVSERTYKVRVSNYQTVHYAPPVANSVLVADVSFNQTTVNVDSSIDYRENDFIMINDEILKITGINYTNHQFTVERSQFNTPIRLHAATNVVSLHIPENDKDYRLNVGAAISTPGVSGVIYSIDKLTSSIEVRVASGSLTNTSVITDSSTPTGREVTINMVGPVTTYWEIDPTNTGNYYVRDLQFRVSRGTEYILDTSDGSNFDFNLSLSEDSTNINPISNIEYLGTPGTAGSRLIIKKSALLDTGVTRVYYYEQNNKIANNNKFFSVLSLPEGTQNITVVNDNVFKYTVTRQPEQLQYVNVISYDTLSKSALGRIKEISVVDGGEGYKKLPKILGVVHGQLDNARFTQSIAGGGFESVSVITEGSRYSNNVTLHVNTLTGSGAILTPSIVGGRIVSVSIDNIGSDYDTNDTITVIDNDAEIFAESTNIGKVKSVRFNNNGSQFTSDYTLAKSLVFNKKVIVVNVGSNSYKLAETVRTSSFEGVIAKIQELGKNSLLLDIKVRSGELNIDDILTGAIQSTTSKVYSIDDPDIFGNVDGFMKRVGFFDSDLGKISSSSQKITDSYYYQDFSYVIRSTKGLSDYKKYVDETTHPLGFKLFGEVSVENDVDFQDTVSGNAFSIGLAADPHANEILIQLPTINVESDIVFKKYELSTVKAANLKSYLGTGAAALNFLDNQIEAVQIADLSSSLNKNTNTYNVITNDGTFPTDTKNTSVLLALNEVFQEPIDTGSITNLSYDAGLATFTTSTDHNLAITIAGQRYPDNKYVHVSGITNSVQNINFNDKFEIYDVPSSNTFRVKISNPNGTLTNNDPAVCADVQSTIGTLTGILTYYLDNPSVALPVKNTGIWLDPTQSTIVSANRHRDGANLIYANKQEIIDRSNAEISLQYPDFFYPNDPQTTSTSRYKDAYRYIQRNRQEIIDRAAAHIAVGHPDFVYPGDPATASDYRFKDAYRLIQQNRTEIIDNAWTTMQGGSNPADAAVETKCKRDIGLFIDYTSLDLVNGGNEYARKFALQYFDGAGNPLTNGLLGEELASVDGFTAARDNMILAFTNQLTVTDSTITPDPAGAPLCANVTSAITVLAGIVNDAITAGSTTGLPAETTGSNGTGEEKCKRDIGIFIDAVSLDVHTGGNIYARKFLKKYFNSNGNTLIVNGLSGEIPESITAFNKARDMMKLAITNQLLDKDLTVTPGNAEYWGSAVGTPTNATYDAVTGVLDVTIANHGLANSDNILLKENSFIFTCSMDGNVAEKSYPRVTDNAFNTNMAVSNVTTDTFQVNIGTSPLVNFDVTAANYDPQSGDVELTIGTHTLSKYETIKLRDESITFTCDLDNNQTNHSYPKTAILSETIENADYDPASGVMLITINNHGWEDGDFIKFDNNSITFTCALDNNQTNHSYPRAGSDPYAEKWLPITEATEDTFKVNIGVSSDTSPHTFVSASVDGLKKKKDKTYDTPVPITSTTATTITINVGSSTDTSIHTFVSALSDAVTSGGNYSHTFVRAATDAVVLPVVTSVIPNTDPAACADVRSNIHNISEIVTFYLNQGSLLFPTALPNKLIGIPSSGEAVCRRDLGLVIDAIIDDMRTGGNSNIREVVQRYLQGNSLLPDGLAGEVSESITAFNKASDMMKLAIANQLYEKDFTILPDFLTTSGTIDSSDVTGSTYTKGQFNYTNATLNLLEAPKFGTTFHSIFFKFINSGDDTRYSYKVRDILFDGTSRKFELKKLNGSNITTEPDENLLVFIDGVLQIYGESYTIDRSVNPNKIVFTKVHSAERQFFAYTFSKYKVLNNFSHKFDSSEKSFEFKFADDIILPPDDHQILVLLDGVPQLEGSSYTVVDNVLTFTEAPTVGKNCHCLYFYGKTFDKTISIWNGNVFEKLEYLGDNNPEGCRYFNKLSNTGDIIFPGDLIKIDGETTKKIIKIDERALENTDNLLYTAFVYTDNSYVRGKNAVANAIVTGVPISGGNTVGIQSTVGIQGTQGVPPVFDYQVSGVNITNQGLEYDVAPIILFKVECGNPGTGAEAFAEITNGRVTNVVITNPGSGYTEAPELIFAKKYEIIRPQTPLFAKRELIVDSTSYNAINGFGVVSDRNEEYLLPIIISQLIISNTTHVETESRLLKDTSDAGLAYNLQTFDNNKFQYEPLNLNDPLASYLGTGVTIEHMNRYAPALTVGDFTTHRGVSQGATEPAIINIGPEAYVSYGLTLNGAINDTVTTVTVTGNVTNFPPTGYLEFGNESMEYTSISGQDFTVVRGSKGTTASAQADGDYLRLAWRG